MATSKQPFQLNWVTTDYELQRFAFHQFPCTRICAAIPRQCKQSENVRMVQCRSRFGFARKRSAYRGRGPDFREEIGGPKSGHGRPGLSALDTVPMPPRQPDFQVRVSANKLAEIGGCEYGQRSDGILVASRATSQRVPDGRLSPSDWPRWDAGDSVVASKAQSKETWRTIAVCLTTALAQIARAHHRYNLNWRNNVGTRIGRRSSAITRAHGPRRILATARLRTPWMPTTSPAIPKTSPAKLMQDGKRPVPGD